MERLKKVLSYSVYFSFGLFLIGMGICLFLTDVNLVSIFQWISIGFFSLSILLLILLFILSPNVLYKEAKKNYKKTKDILLSCIKTELNKENMKMVLKIKEKDKTFFFITSKEEIPLPFEINSSEYPTVLFLIFSIAINKNFISHSPKSFFFYLKNGFLKFKVPYEYLQIVDFELTKGAIEHQNKYICNFTHEENLNFDWRFYH